MALEVVVLDKDEYKALIDNQADEDELEYLKACQYALESFNKVRGLCPKCKKSVIIDGWVCPCCGYDSSGEELYKYGDTGNGYAYLKDASRQGRCRTSRY